MKKIICTLLLSIPLFSHAACYGTGAFRSCTDDSGNSYTVQRYGNTTQVQGYNANTGSTWNQSSSTYGNTTQTYGTAVNGQNWNSTTIVSPGMVNQSGTDSNGRSFNKTCTSAGCY